MALPLRVWDGSQWVDVGSGTGQVYYSNTQPASGSTGDLWVDSDGTASSLDPADFVTLESASATYVAASGQTGTVDLSSANIKLTNINNPSASSGGLDISSTGVVSGALPYPNRNLLYNGAMQVAQRGTSTASITEAGYYTADRWYFNEDNTTGTWTNNIQADAPTGSGLQNSYRILCTTANTSLDASDFLAIDQRLEGQDVQRIAKGTASAKKLTLSFWVKSNVTGTYIAELVDQDNTRQVSAAYTISASATWEKKTITFPADTTGAFDNDNGLSFIVRFAIAMGSNYTSGTLQTTWASTVNANRYVGQTNLSATLNNYWQITGVQLETGDVATDFEFKSYGQELAECQRYYQTPSHGWGNFYSSSECKISFDFATTMRDTPTLIVGSTLTNIIEQNGVNTLTPTSISGNYRDKSGAVLQFFGMSGATAQNGAFFRVGSSPSAIAFSAEL